MLDKQQKQLHITTLGAGILSTLAYLYLCINSQYYGDATLTQMLSVSVFCAGLCVAVWLQQYYSQQNISIAMILGFAVLFRAIGLFAFPILEDDAFRYLWDGRQTILNGTPYTLPPSAFFDDETINGRFEDILDTINYPHVATVYGPASQWIFAFSYLIAPGEIWPLQLIFALADMGIILLLLRFAKPSAVLLYAWCPLIIKEFAFTAHPDVFGAFLMVCALYAYQKKQSISVGILMALATGIKIFPLLILPFLLQFNWRGWLAFVITIVGIALPFGVQQAWFPEGLKVMSGDWFFNAPLYLSYIQLTPNGYSSTTLKVFLLLSLAVGCGSALLIHLYKHLKDTDLRTLPRGDLLFGFFFLCLPALNPWYLVWMLPFAAIKPSLWAWTASLMLLMSYISGINLGTSDLGSYQIPNWALIVQFGTIFAALLGDLIIHRKKSAAL